MSEEEGINNKKELIKEVKRVADILDVLAVIILLGFMITITVIVTK